jgi:excisionase family DNA binding protein
MTAKKFIKKTELAKELNVCLRTIDTWMHYHKIPYLKIGPRMVRFDLDKVNAALARYTIKEVQ